MNSEQMGELPDPRDRSRPWHDGQPAYLAHYCAMIGVSDKLSHFDWHPLVNAYSEAIPTPEALQLLTSLSPLLEIGAGGGYWARLLAEKGADIIATDRMAPRSNTWISGSEPWMTVVECDALQAVQWHPDRTLFACWPPRPSGYMQTVLPAYRGNVLALITDGPMDPTLGPDPLYGLLEREWDLGQQLELPHWPGRHDSLMIWRRLE